MKSKELISSEEARKKVSELIFSVLTRKTCVKDALMCFPPDVNDASVECAWHALVHYEADIDLRKRDPEYAKEQDDYLEMAAFILAEGNPLPENIIRGYNKYYEKALIPKTKGFKSLLKSIFRLTI